MAMKMVLGTRMTHRKSASTRVLILGLGPTRRKTENPSPICMGIPRMSQSPGSLRSEVACIQRFLRCLGEFHPEQNRYHPHHHNQTVFKSPFLLLSACPLVISLQGTSPPPSPQERAVGRLPGLEGSHNTILSSSHPRRTLRSECPLGTGMWE